MQDIKKILVYLNKDEYLSKAISKFEKPVLKKDSDFFSALVRSIIYQQISGKAAETIESRFKTLFQDKKYLPEVLLDLDDDQFKKVGISSQKMKYLRDLATKFLDGTVNLKNFNKMTDEEISTNLVSVKGVGLWTTQMFLIFTLNRMDVFPIGDLGIKKGFKSLFGLKKLPDDKKMQKLSEKWKPYRTIATLYLWKVADAEK